MTLRRAVLDEIFDSWLHDIAHVFFGRHLIAFQRRSLSARIKTEPSAGKLRQYGTKARNLRAAGGCKYQNEYVLEILGRLLDE